MTRRALGPVLAIALVSAPAGATGRVARRTGLSCLSCHLDPAGRTALNERGKRYQGEGMRVAFDAALTVPGEWAPLSPGGVTMLRRRYRELGRRLFQMRDLGRTRQACASCHAAGAALSPSLWEDYPRHRPDMGRWTSLAGAIEDCLVKRVGSEPLAPGSRSLMALEIFLREGRSEGRAVRPAAATPRASPPTTREPAAAAARAEVEAIPEEMFTEEGPGPAPDLAPGLDPGADPGPDPGPDPGAVPGEGEEDDLGGLDGLDDLD